MKRFVIILVALFLSVFSYGQELISVGPRVGYFVGVDYKQFFSGNKDFSFQATATQRIKNSDRTMVTRFTALLVFQQSLRLSRKVGGKLYYFYGGGAHFGRGRNDFELNEQNSITKTETGVDATIGIEFVSRKVPIDFAVDFTPYYNFKYITTHREWVGIGISMRYRIGNRRR